jgi:integrase
MRSLAPDHHVVLTLKGQYGRLDAAPAAYRQVDSTSLQQLFDAGMRRCGVGMPSSPPASSSASAVGSSRALTASAWQPLTSRLQAAIAQARAPLETWLRPDPLPIASVVEYVQLVAAYAYLGWLLATGARPASANTHTIITGTHAWIRDKGSRRGTESRVIPLHPSIVQQLSSHQALVDQTILLMTRHHTPIDDQRRSDQQGPTWLSLSQHRRPHCQLRAIHHADLRGVLSRRTPAAPLPDTVLPANNATRHSTTTALYRVIPEAELDALVGHARIGRDRTHPRANAPLPQSKACQQHIGAWLQATGYRVLDVEIPPWQ